MADDLERHMRFVAERPNEFTAARALVDHVEEKTGCSRAVALRTVARAMRPQRCARRLAVALKWWTDRGQVGRWLRMEVNRILHVIIERSAYAIVVHGWHPPRGHLSRFVPHARRARGTSVTITSGWIIMRVAEFFRFNSGPLAICRAKAGPRPTVKLP